MCINRKLKAAGLQQPAMGEEQSEDRHKRSKGFSDGFYTAVLDEDVGGTEGLVKYRSKRLIEMQDGAFWKGFNIPPLHLAASYRRAQSLERLLSAGADAQVRDQLGRTALHLLLTNWPVVPSRSEPRSKFWAAVTRAGAQAAACLRLLCEHGANINAPMEEQSQQTALHVSVRSRALAAVRMLSSYGADVNAVDGAGMSPLHVAAGILHKDIAAALISQGADVNQRMQHSGNAPLHLAAVAVMTKTTRVLEEELSCISELLERGAKPDTLNQAGMSTLHLACSLGNEVLADLLLRHGAGVNRRSAAGESCLFLFLNHRPNLRNGALLTKLLSLSSPLSVCSRSGRLPSTLTQPGFFKQRELLVTLTRQPKTLQDICKSSIYLKHIRARKEEVREALPESLFGFVFNQWESHNISFVAETEEPADRYV